MVTLQEIKQNESIRVLIKAGNRYLEHMGFTEHGPRHVGYVSKTASYILKALGYSPREVELAAIAGWVHDVGNSVNRHDHGPLGAVLLLPILQEAGMDMADIMEIITAVGNHEEQSGFISSNVSAALALGDKSDAHKSRVRNGKPDETDIHDRVNYSVKKAELKINGERTLIKLKLSVDTNYGSVMDYFEIFMGRMLLCRKAAEALGLQFKLMINEQQLI